jgi:hypothetical protein
MRGKRGQLIGGLVLLTLGALFILDRLLILEIYISWPLVLVALGVGLFLSNPYSLASWIVGGIGVILFVVNFVIAFFPEVEAWSDLVWPTILVIIGVLLLYRYYHTGQPPKSKKGSPESQTAIPVAPIPPESPAPPPEPKTSPESADAGPASKPENNPEPPVQVPESKS